jgi:lipopolysaccharide transport protein LptA
MSWRRAAVVGLLAVACDGQGPPRIAMPEAPMQGVVVTVGEREPVVATLAGAWLSPDGGGGVEVSAALPSAPPLSIDGARSSWNLRTRTWVFEEDVVVTRGDVTLTTTRLEVSYEGERIREVRASGGVTITQGSRVARGATAVLTADDGRVVLEGSPEITEGPHHLEGRRIAVYLDDERVECDACRLVVEGSAVAPLDPAR